MITLKLKINKTRLYLESPVPPNGDILAADSYRYIRFKVDIPADDNLPFSKIDREDIIVTFKNLSSNVTCKMLLDEYYSCDVPYEVVAHTGTIVAYITGENYEAVDDEEYLSNRVVTNTVSLFKQKEDNGAFSTSNPTPSEYEQFVSEARLAAGDAFDALRATEGVRDAAIADTNNIKTEAIYEITSIKKTTESARDTAQQYAWQAEGHKMQAQEAAQQAQSFVTNHNHDDKYAPIVHHHNIDDFTFDVAPHVHTEFRDGSTKTGSESPIRLYDAITYNIKEIRAKGADYSDLAEGNSSVTLCSQNMGYFEEGALDDLTASETVVENSYRTKNYIPYTFGTRLHHTVKHATPNYGEASSAFCYKIKVYFYNANHEYLFTNEKVRSYSAGWQSVSISDYYAYSSDVVSYSSTTQSTNYSSITDQEVAYIRVCFVCRASADCFTDNFYVSTKAASVDSYFTYIPEFNYETTGYLLKLDDNIYDELVITEDDVTVIHCVHLEDPVQQWAVWENSGYVPDTDLIYLNVSAALLACSYSISSSDMPPMKYVGSDPDILVTSLDNIKTASFAPDKHLVAYDASIGCSIIRLKEGSTSYTESFPDGIGPFLVANSSPSTDYVYTTQEMYSAPGSFIEFKNLSEVEVTYTSDIWLDIKNYIDKQIAEHVHSSE